MWGFLNHLRLANSECLTLVLFSVQDYPQFLTFDGPSRPMNEMYCGFFLMDMLTLLGMCLMEFYLVAQEMIKKDEGHPH